MLLTMSSTAQAYWEILNLVFSIVLDLVAIVIFYNCKGKEKLWK